MGGHPKKAIVHHSHGPLRGTMFMQNLVEIY